MMLRIREEQVAALSRYVLDEFESCMVMHLRERFAEKTKSFSDADLRQLISQGIARSKTYRVIAEKDVRRFLECMVMHGVRFDQEPKTAWAGKILRNKRLHGSKKMDQIAEYELFVLKGAA